MTEQESFKRWWSEATQVDEKGLVKIPSAPEIWLAALEWAEQGQEPIVHLKPNDVVGFVACNEDDFESFPVYNHPTPPPDVAVLVEALSVANEYAKWALFDFDEKYGGNPAMERQRNEIADDIKTIEQALAKWEGKE